MTIAAPLVAEAVESGEVAAASKGAGLADDLAGGLSSGTSLPKQLSKQFSGYLQDLGHAVGALTGIRGPKVENFEKEMGHE